MLAGSSDFGASAVLSLLCIVEIPSPSSLPRLEVCLSSPTTLLLRLRGDGEELVFPRRRGSHRLDHLADELGAGLGHGFVLGEGHVGEQWRVADDAGFGIAVDVGLPLPARRVRVSRADVLGLQPLELLLRAQFVGLESPEAKLVSFSGVTEGCHRVVEGAESTILI